LKQQLRLKLAAYPLILLCMAGCNLMPDVDTTSLDAAGSDTAQDSWPQLLPIAELSQMQSGLDARPDAVAAETQTLSARVAALRARAAALSAPVLTDPERQRLAEAAASR